MRKLTLRLLFIFTMLTTTALIAQTKQQSLIYEKNDTPSHTIVVFVHGIINIQPHLNFWNIIRFIYDQIEDSIYARAVELMRKDSYFQQYSAMQGLGLQPIDRNIIQPGAASNCLASLFEIVSKKNATAPGINHYYTFGWSGLMSSRMRQLEAELLYKALCKELQAFKKNGIHPKITVIGYSHGGNLTINLGQVHNQIENPFISIDQLILMGVPLIPENYQSIASPLFKKIYHFYSPGDRVQPIDCLSGGILFSSKIFKQNRTFSLPPNLQQIQYRVKRLALKRKRKRTFSFNKRMLRNADPGHTELWSFGWAHNYRTHMPLYPLPSVTFVQYIINYVEELLPQVPHIIADIRPFDESILLSSYDGKKAMALSFFTNAELNELGRHAEFYRPLECTKEAFERNVSEALAQATVQKTAEWNKEKVSFS